MSCTSCSCGWSNAWALTTSGSSPPMPTWRAIAAAVSGWSPVISTIRMPAPWQRATASITSARGGSRIVTNPRKHSSRSASSRSGARAPEGSDRRASASTRRPWPAKLSTCRVTRSRSAGSSGRCSPSAKSTLDAPRQHRLGRALGVQPVVALAGVQGRHQLALRVEVVLVRAPLLAAGGVDRARRGSARPSAAPPRSGLRCSGRRAPGARCCRRRPLRQVP